MSDRRAGPVGHRTVHPSAYVYGIPITAVGTIMFTLQVRDGVGGTARQAFSLTINPGTPPSDSVTITSAKWSARFHRLYVVATDPIPYVAQTVSVTATGQQIGPLFVANGNPHTGSFFSEANPRHNSHEQPGSISHLRGNPHSLGVVEGLSRLGVPVALAARTADNG